eukprot:gene15721-18679_t
MTTTYDPFALTPKKKDGPGFAVDDDEEDIVATQSGEGAADAPTTEDSSKFWGELLSLGDKLRSVSLSDESLVLGRLKTCNIHVTEAVVSAKHCRLFRSNDNVLIQDLSTNGTFLNGRAIGRGNLEVVKNGDRISLAGASADNQLSYIFKDLTNDDRQRPVWETLVHKDILCEYDCIGELGRGNFSIVYLGVNKTTATKVAIKDIDLAKYHSNPRFLIQLNREIEILKSTQHPNIVTIYDIFQSGNHIYIVMEL